MQGVNDYVAQAHHHEITKLNMEINRLKHRISNAQEYLKGRAYPENAINQAQRELNLAMNGQ